MLHLPTFVVVVGKIVAFDEDVVLTENKHQQL